VKKKRGEGGRRELERGEWGLTVDWDSGRMERAAVAPDVQVGANTWVNGNAGETRMLIQDGVCETPEFRLPGPRLTHVSVTTLGGPPWGPR
jgi:hypothetical protein